MRKSFLKLLHLLGSNQEKLQVIQESQDGQELVEVYTNLTNDFSNNLEADYTGISDEQIKHKIINHLHITPSQLWYLFNFENSFDLKQKCFTMYCQKNPIVINPKLLGRMIINRIFIQDNNLVKVCQILWGCFVVSLPLIYLAPWVFGLIFVFLNFLWAISKGFSDKEVVSRMTEFGMGLIVISLIPLLIPLLLIGGTCLAGYLVFSYQNERLLPQQLPKSLEEEDYNYYRLSHWA